MHDQHLHNHPWMIEVPLAQMGAGAADAFSEMELGEEFLEYDDARIRSQLLVFKFQLWNR